MTPSVGPLVLLDLHSMGVSGGDSLHPHPVGVKPRVVGDGVPKVELVNFAVKPINFFLVVLISIWLWAILTEPGQFWRMHQ